MKNKRIKVIRGIVLWIKKSPFLVILFLFLLLSIIMTKVSYKNYFNNTLNVNFVASSSEELYHEIQFFGTCEYNSFRQEFTIKWSIPLSIDADLKTNDEVYIANPIIMESRDSHEKIGLDVSIDKFFTATVSGSYIDEETKEQYITAKLNDTEFMNDSENVIVQVNYTGKQQKWVVPASCVYSDTYSKGQEAFVYVIKEEPKVWGTEYYIKKREVYIIESNGDMCAISLYGDENVVKNVKDNRLYDKKIVRLKTVDN